MKDRHQAAYIPFRCSGETGQLIGRLAAQQHRPRSEVLRDLVEHGLVSVGVKSDEDYLSGLVRQTVEETAKPHVERLAAISANLSADLLGLGNAATPLGIRAACRMSRGCKGTASDELCLLVVLNTASIQLLPTTLAGVRASLGAADPFDILPAVWLTSLLSVLAGLLAAKLFARLWRN